MSRPFVCIRCSCRARFFVYGGIAYMLGLMVRTKAGVRWLCHLCHSERKAATT